MDYTYFLVIIGIFISIIASGVVKSSFNKYSKIATQRGFTGKEVAEYMLMTAGINDVRIETVEGELTDHYDPRDRVLRLSEDVYYGRTIAATGVAAHECGHAIQDARNYVPLRIRENIVPVANIGSKLSFPIIFVGCLLGGMEELITIGIIMFVCVVLFHIVTLPVEFNASRRAVGIVTDMGILNNEEAKGAKKVLSAAAFTYIASTLVALLQLLRLLILFGRRND